MASYEVFGANALTGGADGALDAIDGANLADGDLAIAIDATNDKAYFYTLNASSGAAESSPDIISPDTNAGDKRWILTNIVSDTAYHDVVQVMTAAGNLVIKNQTGSTIATFANAQSLTLANGTDINEFSTDGGLAGNSDDALPTEQAMTEHLTYYTGKYWPGYVERAKFAYKDADEIYIYGGQWALPTEAVYQKVHTTSTLSFHCESTGSNANSSDFGASEWHYLYIDESAVNNCILTAAMFLNSTTAPSWNATYSGWYNGNDRCVFAFKTTAGSDLDIFYHSGDFVQYDDFIADINGDDVDDDWADTYTLTVPAFCSKVAATILGDNNGVAATHLGYIRPAASAGTGIPTVYTSPEADDVDGVTISFITDVGGGIDVKYNLNDAALMYLYTQGWYFPEGM